MVTPHISGSCTVGEIVVRVVEGQVVHALLRSGGSCVVKGHVVQLPVLVRACQHEGQLEGST